MRGPQRTKVIVDYIYSHTPTYQHVQHRMHEFESGLPSEFPFQHFDLLPNITVKAK
ncbi:hypothetical protein RvVAT039_31050 [Agrobacterium vitis]|nr:hypothetical protein RvVAT039_31050 [Agrobacterium vitis]